MNARMSGVMAGLVVTVMAATPAPVAAQAADDSSAASAEELMRLFQRQKTRGLKLAPNTGVAADTAAADGTATPAPAAATTVANAVTTAEDGTTQVPVVYQEIDLADQVNIRVNFDFDSAVLRDDEKPKLSELCKALAGIEGVFRIVGHTDAAGTDAYNEKLSLLRAEEVKRYLVADCNLPADRLQAVGVGERFLFDANDPRSEENRRVEFQALS